MNSNRRGFIASSLSSMMAVGAGPLWLRPFFARFMQNEQTPRTGHMGEPTDLPVPDSKSILEHNEEKIQGDVERLYVLAGELRDQVKKNNSSDVLSLDLLKKAEEVERLAHQIRSLAKG